MSDIKELSLLIEIRQKMDGFTTRLDTLERVINLQLEILNKLESSNTPIVIAEVADKLQEIKAVTKKKVNKEKLKEG